MLLTSWLRSLTPRSFFGRSPGVRAFRSRVRRTTLRPLAWKAAAERLEDRALLAAASLVGTELRIDYTATGATAEAVTVTSDGTTITLTGDVTGTTTFAQTSVDNFTASDSGGSTAQALTLGAGNTISFADFSSSGVETVTLNTAITASEVTVTSRSFTLSAGGVFSQGGVTVEATGAITTAASINSRDAVTLTAGGDIMLNGSVAATTGMPTATSDIIITSTGGGISSTNAAGLFTGGGGEVVLLAANDVNLQGSVSTRSGPSDSDGGVSVTAGSDGSGGITTGSGASISTGNGGSVSFAAPGTISLGGFVSTNNSGTATSDITVNSSGGAVTVNVGLGTGGGGAITVTADGLITLNGGLSANGTGVSDESDILVTSSNGGITTNSNGGITTGSGGIIILNAAGAISLGNQLSTNAGPSPSGGNISVTSTGGTISTMTSGAIFSTGDGGGITLQADGTIDLKSTLYATAGTQGGGISLTSDAGGISTDGNATLSTGNGGAISLTAAGNIMLDAGLSANFGTPTAASNINVTSSGGGITTGSGDGLRTGSGGSISVDAETAVTLGGELSVVNGPGTSGGTIDVTSDTGTVTTTARLSSAGGDITVQADGLVDLGDSVSAATSNGGGSVFITSDNGGVTTRSGAALEAASGGGITVAAAGDVTFNRNVTTVQSGNANTGDIAVTSTGGSINTVGSSASFSAGDGGGITLLAANNVSLQATVAATRSGNAAPDDGSISVTAQSGNVSITDSGSLETGVSGDITVNATAAGSSVTVAGSGISAQSSGSGTGTVSINSPTVNLAADIRAATITGTAATVNVQNTSADIQDGIDVAAGGGTVTVGDGTYIENLTITKNLTLVSENGRASTTIQGTQTGSAYGAVYVGGTTTGVTIGGTDTGFTIQGFEEIAVGQEAGAIYIQGSHSNVTIRGNEIVAAGDAGLLSTFNTTLSNAVIDDNIFSGKTFVGANPAAGNQFTVPNVARQLVVIGGGSGGGNTSNVTFTKNQITGTAGGYGTNGAELGNTLVTIDSNGATITGNTFAGTTTAFGYQLRARGPATTISGNTVDDSNTTQTSGGIYVQNTGQTAQQVAAANDFSGPTATASGTTGGVFSTIQAAVNNASIGGTVTASAGTFVENVTINKAVTLVGAQSGQDADVRAGNFVNGKADDTLETVLTTPSNDSSETGGNDLIRVTADGVTIDGLVLDGNNAALAPSGAMVGTIDVDVRYAITNLAASSVEGTGGASFDANGLLVTNSVIQNTFGGVVLDGPYAAPQRASVTANVIRNLASYLDGDVNNNSAAVASFNNFVVDATDNTIDLSLQTTQAGAFQTFGYYYTNHNSSFGTGRTRIADNRITLGAAATGLFLNLAYTNANPLVVSGNTINAAAGVTPNALNQPRGITVWSFQAGSSATLTNNTIGSTGGQLARGVYLWNNPSNAVSITGGSIGNSVVGLTMDAQTVFGGAAATTVDVSNVSINASSVGVQVRTLGTGSPTPSGDQLLNLTDVAITLSAGGATGIRVFDDVADGFTNGVGLLGGVTVTGGSTGLFLDGAEAVVAGDDLTDTAFSGQSGDFITLANGAEAGNELDATAATFGGLIGAAGLARNYAIEDKINHAVDAAGLGFVRVKAANVFVTPASGSIQRGVDAATAGDTVNVAAGTFAENVLINKALELLGAQAGVDARTGRAGASETILDATNNAGRTLFNVSAGGVVIDGFTVQNSTNANLSGAGIRLAQSAAGTRVRNNIVENNIVGLFLANAGGTQQLVVENNLFRNNNQPGPVTGTAIYTDDTIAGGSLANVLIQNNAFRSNDNAGVLLAGSAQTDITISNNSFTNDGSAVVLFGTTDATVSGNTVTGSTGTGVFIGGGVSDVEISGNTFTDGATRAIRAIDVAGTPNANLTISGNTLNQDAALLPDGTALIQLDDVAGTSSVTGNGITFTGIAAGNIIGVLISETAASNAGTANVTGNTFSGTTADLVVRGTATDDTITASLTRVTVNGTDQVVNYDSTVGTLSVEGLAGADDFTVAPSASTTYFLDGGDPTGATGDSLTYNAPAGTNTTQTGTPAAGSLTSTGYQTVSYANFEALAVGDTPVANDDMVTTDEDTPVTIAVLGNDTNLTNAPLTVTIVTQSPNGTAVVNPDNTITFTPDANFNGSASFTYTVADGDGGVSNTATVTVTVNPVNDQPTAVMLSNSSVAENQPRGTTVGTLSTADNDPTDTFTYALVPGAANNGAFTIAGDQLRTNFVFNFEAKPSYLVRVRVTDSAGATFDQLLTITILDVNESPQTVTLSGTSVDENQPAGTAVGTLGNADPDAGDTFTYSLVPGAGAANNAAFTIVGNELRTSAVFNFEAKSSYSVRVQVRDAAGLTAVRTFTITVRDLNESPRFVTLSNNTVVENQPAGTTVGTLGNGDPDAGDTFTYTLVSGPGSGGNAAFTIVANQLQTAAPLDFEAQSTYQVRIQVRDAAGLIAVRTFTISVTDQNEAPTAVALTPSSVAENQPAGTTVGTLTATDQDAADTFTYTLVGGAGSEGNSAFTISGDQLVTAASFDFEAQPSYSIRVRVTDGSGVMFDQVLTVTVLNLNEGPTAVALNPSNIAENLPAGSTVGTLTSTDPDAGGSYTYTLVPNAANNAAFTIAGDRLQTNFPLNFEVKPSFKVLVRVTDQGGLSFDQLLTVTVLDVAETPRTVTLTGGSVAENRSVGTLVGTLGNLDPDAGDTFTYQLVSGPGAANNSAFLIDGNRLLTNAEFNFEAKSTYFVRVRVTDQTGLSAERVLSVNITDVNEGPTNITPGTVAVAENRPAGAVVANLAAVDPDAGDAFTYTLVSGVGSEGNSSFTVNGDQLRTTASFDFEAQDSYRVRVRVTDRAGLFVERSLLVSITNVNESPAAVILSNSTVAENQPVGTTVGTLIGIDPDAGDAFTYQLVNGQGAANNAAFTIVGNQLKTATVFNFEAKSSYQIRVRVTDAGGLFRESLLTITVGDLAE